MQEMVIKRRIKKNKSSNKKRFNYSYLEGFLFIGVGLFLFIVFVLYPQIKNIYMAFTKYNIMPGQPSEFVGLANFKKALLISSSESQKFYLALRNTFLYAIVTVPGQMVIGLIIAVLINSLTKGRTFYKVMLYIPVITSWVVVSILFKYLFQDGDAGFINYVLSKLHLIKEPISWLQNTWTGNLVIWILGIWKGIGWVMIIYIAALQGIPNDFYEAAEIDGANALRKFLSITVPILKPTTFYILINLIIGAFGVFVQVMMITGGAPLGTTDVVNNYMYSRAFQFMEFGYASAIGLISAIIILTITIINKKLFKYDETLY